MRFRQIRALFLAVALASAAWFPHKASAAGDLPVLGATKTAILVWLADELGYFEGVPITLKMYQSGTTASRDLIEGKVQLATSSEFAFVSNVLEHQHLRIVSSLSATRTARLIARSDRVGRRLVDLKGKRIGITRKSIGQYLLWQTLFLEGLSLDEIEVVDLSPLEIVDALAIGGIDAGLTWEPYIYEARSRLGSLVHDFPEQSGQYYSFLLTGTADWLESNERLVEAALGALIRAERFAEQNPEESKFLIGRRYDVDRAFVDYFWPQHTLRVALSQDLLRQMEQEAQWRIEEGLTERRTIPNFLDYIAFAPLKALAPRAVRIIEAKGS